MILTEKELVRYFADKNFDIRKSRNGRWIDQKCTPDVLSVISDFILSYLNAQERKDVYFSVKDIWYYEKSGEVIKSLFKKPDVKQDTAKNEYDKLFMQPMKLLAAAGVLIEYPKMGKNGSHLFRLNDTEIIGFISKSDYNAYLFLVKYIEKTLIDSGLKPDFDLFLEEQSQDSYRNLKTRFSQFTRNNTNIKGKYEPNRIFPKVLNPLSFHYGAKGSERGYLSKNLITYDRLMYNRDNFRDIYLEKPKNITREDYIKQQNIQINREYSDYQIQKSKELVKEYNNQMREGCTEHLEYEELGVLASQVHHIFPRSDYKEIAAFPENLISLTPNQHYLKAHKENNTRYIDVYYQKDLLLSKLKIIENSIIKGHTVYSLDKFKYVLSVGFEDENYLKTESDVHSIRESIEKYYLEK